MNTEFSCFLQRWTDKNIFFQNNERKPVMTCMHREYIRNAVPGLRPEPSLDVVYFLFLSLFTGYNHGSTLMSLYTEVEVKLPLTHSLS